MFKKRSGKVAVISAALSMLIVSGCSVAAETPAEKAKREAAALKEKAVAAAKERQKKLQEELKKNLPGTKFNFNPNLSEAENKIVEQFMQGKQLSQKSVEAMSGLVSTLCNLLDEKQPDSAKNQDLLHKIDEAAENQTVQANWDDLIRQVISSRCPKKLPVLDHKPGNEVKPEAKQ